MAIIIFGLGLFRVACWLAAGAAILLGVFATIDTFRKEPVLPDPILALINLFGYVALVAGGIALIACLTT